MTINTDITSTMNLKRLVTQSLYLKNCIYVRTLSNFRKAVESIAIIFASLTIYTAVEVKHQSTSSGR